MNTPEIYQFFQEPFLILLYVIVSAIFSYHYYQNCFEIFDVPNNGKSKEWIFHQKWFNFLGSIIGWICLWLLLRGIFNNSELGFTHLLLLILAFIGMTGHLPMTLFMFLASLRKLFEKYLSEK